MELYKQTIEKIELGPVMGPALLKLTTLLRDKDTPNHKLAELLQLSPVLSAIILGQANGMLLGSYNRITDMNFCLVRLGRERLIELLKGVAAGLKTGRRCTPNLEYKRFWEHSIITAHIARKLLVDFSGLEEWEIQKMKSAVYMAGLLHDISLSALDYQFPELYLSLRDEAQRRHKSMAEVEIERGFAGHGEESANLLSAMNLPMSITDPIRYHHNPAHCPVEFRFEALAVSLASYIANVGGYNCFDYGKIPTLEPYTWNLSPFRYMAQSEVKQVFQEYLQSAYLVLEFAAIELRP